MTAEGIVLLIDCVVAISAVDSGLFIETRSKYKPPWTELMKSHFVALENLFYLLPNSTFILICKSCVFFYANVTIRGECVQHCGSLVLSPGFLDHKWFLRVF